MLVFSLVAVVGSTYLSEPCVCDYLRRVCACVEYDCLAACEPVLCLLLCYIVDRE